MDNCNVQSQEISILPPQEGSEIPGGGRGIRDQINKVINTKLNWNFRRDREV